MSNMLPTSYQEFIHKSRYARWLPEESRREEWSETVNRYLDYMSDHLKKKHKFDLSLAMLGAFRSRAAPGLTLPCLCKSILRRLLAVQEPIPKLFFGPKRLQERSKRPPRGFLRASASKIRFGPRFGPVWSSKK